MNIRSPSGLNKVIKSSQGNTATIKAAVMETLGATPTTFFAIPAMERYLTFEDRREIVRRLINNSSDNGWIRYVRKMRDYIPDDELREKVLAIFHNSPWWFYTQSEEMRELFPNEYFKNLLGERGRFKDPKMFDLFLLYNAHQSPDAFSDPLKSMLKDKSAGSPTIDVDVLGFKEPGFACGGMERNYVESVTKGEGFCLVNGSLFAKFYHKKGDPKKVSYLPARTYHAKNGFVLWENYFYAPSHGQHGLVIDAIERGEKTLYIPDIAVKSVRHCIGLTSESIVVLSGLDVEN